MTKKDKKPSAANSKRVSKLDVHITHLEMSAPPLRHLNPPTRPVIALMRAKNIAPEFFAWLYEQVGKSHHWHIYRGKKGEALYDMINAPECEISVIYADGCPAGFFELDLSAAPEAIEIVHCGLCRDYQGMGVGKWLLSTAIAAAWHHKPERVIVQTNTLDHPAALRLYQRFGFSPYATSETRVKPWS